MEETILSLEKGAMERWRNGDPWGFVEISAEDIIYVDPGRTSPILGLEEFKAFMRQLEGKICYQRSEFIDPRVVSSGMQRSCHTTIDLQSSHQKGALLAKPLGMQRSVLPAGRSMENRSSALVLCPTPAARDCGSPNPNTIVAHKFEGILGEPMTLESAAMERWRKETGSCCPSQILARPALPVLYSQREDDCG